MPGQSKSEAKPSPYVAPQVAKAAGIVPTTLRTWRARGLLTVAKDHEREWTKFTEAEVLLACVMAQLVKSGIELNLASQIGSGLLREGIFDRALTSDEEVRYVAVCDVRQSSEKTTRYAPLTCFWGARADVLLNAAQKHPSTSTVVHVIDLEETARQMRLSLKDAP